MAGNVIRQDVVQIEFDSNLKELLKITNEVDELKKKLTGGIGDDAFEELKDNTKQALKGSEKLQGSLKDLASTSLTKLNSGLNKVGSHLGTIAKKAAGAAYTGLKRMTALSFTGLVTGLGATAAATYKLSEMASDLEETKNKVDVAFGSGLGNFDGAASDVIEWSKTSTTSMGLAQQTALDTAALFGDMGTSMGLTKDAAAEMSMSLTQQAADLASFKNMGIDEVTTALNGVFTGETESLKRLGVVMTQANLEQYALKKGMGKTLDQMTEAEKVQLRYNYVMEKTKNATDDYKRTGGGFANQLRTLTENFKQLGAVLGSMPMGKLASGMKVINDGLAEVQEILGDGFQEGDTDKIMNIINGLIDKGITAIGDGLPKILPVITKVLTTVLNSLVKIIPTLAPILAKGLVQLMISLAKVIGDNRSELVDAAKSVVIEVVKAIYEGFTGKEMTGDAFDNLKSKVDEAFTAIQKIISGVLSFAGKLMTVLGPVLLFIGNTGVSIFGWIGDNINWLLPLVAGLVGAFLAYKAAMVAVKVVTTAVNTVQTIMSATSSLLGTTLPVQAAGIQATGAASATSATQIGMAAKSFMQLGVGVLAIGGGIFLIAAGFWILAQAAISLANAGGGAIAVMLGMVIAIVALAVGAALLGSALTAGAVGFIAFGGAVALVGLGFMLIGVAAMLAANALSIVASLLPIIVMYGIQGGISIAALGIGLYAFAAGALVAGVASLVLGAGLMMVAGALLIMAISLTVITTMFGLMTAMSTIMAVNFLIMSVSMAVMLASALKLAVALLPLISVFAALTIPSLMFAAAIAPLAALFLVLATSALVFLISVTALLTVFTGIALMITWINMQFLLMQVMFSIMSVSIAAFTFALLPLAGIFLSLVPPVLTFVLTLTPLTVLFTLLATSALVFMASMLVLTITVTLLNALMLIFISTLTVLPQLLILNSTLLNVFSGALTLITMSMIRTVPMLLMFTAALLPLSAVMLVLTPTVAMFTLTMTALMAIFMILSPMAMLFSMSMVVLAPIFLALGKSVPVFAKALSPLAKRFTKIIIPAGLLAVALAPLSAEFLVLAVSATTLLVAMTGLVVTATLLSTLLTMIAMMSTMIVTAFALMGVGIAFLLKSLIPLTVVLLAVIAPLAIVSMSFVQFAAALTLASVAATAINVAFRIIESKILLGIVALKLFEGTFIKTLLTVETVADGISNIMADMIDDSITYIVDRVSELPKMMGDALKSSGDSLSKSLVDVWKEAVKASVGPVNKVLEAANWILKEFGSKRRVITWKPYAKGTNGHTGGNALVNDGAGAELIQMPNGNTFIPKGRNVLMPNAPKGMKVLSAERTAQVMGRKSPTFNYENGIGDLDIWSFIDNPKGLVNEISKSVTYDGMSGFVLNLGKGMVSTVTGEMVAWIEKLFEEEGALSLSNYDASKGVSQWRSTVIRALKMEGQYSAANVARTLFQMQTESGGNPKAINLWDSNAKKGIPSKGLMQVIDPTFRAYARSGFDKNIYDPLSNILASIRYAVSRYGSLAKAYRGTGYANGGLVTKTGLIAERNKPEMVIPLSADKRKRSIDLWTKTGEMLGVSYTPEQDAGYYQSTSVENNNYSPQFTLNITGTTDDRAMARKVKRWIAEALDETFDSMSRKTTRVQQV